MGERPLGTVLVTGAASGLGAATALAVADRGGRVLAIDRVSPPPEIEDAVADVEVADLADARAAEAAVRALAERAGGLDAVFTPAGTDKCGTLAEVDGADWDRVVLVNLIGTAAVVRAALPYLTASHGTVVTCASKFGVVGFTRALAAELQGTVGVTMLVPGGMQTAFFDDRDEKYKPPVDAKLNDPANVAEAVLFALRQPPGCEVRELVITPSVESSWP